MWRSYIIAGFVDPLCPGVTKDAIKIPLKLVRKQISANRRRAYQTGMAFCAFEELWSIIVMPTTERPSMASDEHQPGPLGTLRFADAANQRMFRISRFKNGGSIGSKVTYRSQTLL